MHDRVVIESGVVKLADVVAEFQGDESMINDIKQTVVADLGKALHLTRINREAVESYIESEHKSVDIIYKGSLVTLVQLKKQSYAIAGLIDEVSESLGRLISPVTNDYVVTYTGINDSLSLPIGEVSYRYALPDAVLKKRVVVWVDIMVGDSHAQSIPLWFDVSAFTDVAVALVDIKSGQPLDKRHVVYKKHDLAKYGKALLVGAPFTSLRVVRDVKAGEVISASLLEDIPPVFEGQTVKVVSTQGKVTILLTGVSMDDGGIGEIVRVKRPGTNKHFNAIVNRQGSVSAIGR